MEEFVQLNLTTYEELKLEIKQGEAAKREVVDLKDTLYETARGSFELLVLKFKLEDAETWDDVANNLNSYVLDIANYLKVYNGIVSLENVTRWVKEDYYDLHK